MSLSGVVSLGQIPWLTQVLPGPVPLLVPSGQVVFDQVAPLRFAPARVKAPVRSALVKSSPIMLVPVKVPPVRTDPVRLS